MRMRSCWLAILVGTIAICARRADAQVAAQIPQQPSPRSPTSVPGIPVESCIAGRIFGITEFRCTSCGMSSPRDSSHVVYSFGSEPLFVETDNSNRIKPRAAVVAVNGSPITTRAGADQFAYPPVGTAAITVRRNNVNITFEQPVSSARYCPSQGYRITMDSAIARLGAGAVATGRGGGGRGGARQGGGALLRVDTTGMTRAQTDSANARMRAVIGVARGNIAIVRTPPVEPISNTVQSLSFGFTLKCQPICTQARTRDGMAQYWRFDGFPTITGISAISIAGKAGLRDGDVLLSVNGISPQVEEGALLLNRAEAESALRLEVQRGDKVEKITLRK